MTRYEFLVVHADDLECIIREINICRDKIVAVTQREKFYTIIYEANGNAKEEPV
jgi:hypothetical protein